MSAPQYPGKQRDMECCCQCSCSSCLTVFDATVSLSTQTYRHNYPQASPKRCQKVAESTVWYGSLECPFSPSIQKMINKKPPKKKSVSIFQTKGFYIFLPICLAGQTGTPCQSGLVVSGQDRWSPVCL